MLIEATGIVGSAIWEETLSPGQEVTAILRHPDKLSAHPKLPAEKGDVYNENEVARVVAGHDAVIGAFNPGWTKADIYDLQVKGTGTIITGVSRRPESRDCCSWAAPAVWR